MEEAQASLHICVAIQRATAASEMRRRIGFPLTLLLILAFGVPSAALRLTNIPAIGNPHVKALIDNALALFSGITMTSIALGVLSGAPVIVLALIHIIASCVARPWEIEVEGLAEVALCARWH